MTTTYTLLASNVLGTSSSSVTFSSISSSYRDLVLVVDVLAVSSTARANLRINSDSGTNYALVGLYSGSASFSPPGAGGFTNIQPNSEASTTNKASYTAQLLDYSVTDKHKMLLIRTSSSTDASFTTWRWTNTAVINSIEIFATSSNFAVGSSFYLYGIVS